MTLVGELICVFLTLFTAWIIASNVRPRKYPRGPFLFPVIGNLPQMMIHSRVLKRPRSKLYEQYRQIYGKVFSIQLGPFPAVVLTCPKLIREAWNNPSIQGRPKLHGAAARTNGTVRGILFQDGAEWSEQRRFALRHLKDFGFGKRSMESLIMDEVNELLESFSRDAGTPINTQTKFNVAVLNSLWSIVAGRRYSHDDPLLTNIVNNIHRSLEFRGFVFFFPWLKDWFPKASGWEAYMACMPLSYGFIQDYVRERLDQHSSEDHKEPEHFTDAFINEIKRTKDESSSFYGKRGEETLVATLLDLFVAGIETTSTTLSYTLLYLAMYPQVQEKMFSEISSVIGKNVVTLEDRKKLPYVEATILEVLRFSSLVPTGLVHKTTSEVSLGPYVLPENVWVIANLHGIHHDPSIWTDPENFRPERFLENGKVVKNHEALLPFSFGKRVCLGESLARDELFLFIVSISQNFQVTGEEGVELTSEQMNSNIIAMPKPHKLVLTKRLG